MSTIPPSPYFLTPNPKMSGIGYGIGVSVGIFLLISTITLASYYCARNNQPQQANSHRRRRVVTTRAPTEVTIGIRGIDDKTLETYPRFQYSTAKYRDKNDTTYSCCSICLADYKDSDMLRSLPDCSHLFHQKCIDPWLRLNPTCPVCRTSPLPSPLSTPLAEVVSLAQHRS